MYFHVDAVFMTGKLETLKNTQENIKKKFNNSYSRKVKKFLRVYHEWGRNARGTYANITVEKDVKNLVEGYKKYTGSDLKSQKIPDLRAQL